MKKKIVGIFVMTLLIATALSTMISTTSVADWKPGDDYKMHFPQLPDPTGWDVYATAKVPGFSDVVLSDDFRCTETGWIKDIHIWGSWKGDIVGTIDYFVMGLAKDIPADESPTGYSMPGETLIEWTIRDWEESPPKDPPGMQGWYEPHSGLWIENDHQHYYQYNVDLPEDEWFYQTEGQIYWLFVSAIVKQTPGQVQPLWGWKSSKDHWNDDACWAYWYELNWVDIWEPQPEPITNQFWVELDAQGWIVPRNSGGTDYYEDGDDIHGWYFYPNTDWWNIWFYDHPFDPERYKDIYLSFYAMPTGENAWISVAINWATDLWDGDGPPVPPLTENEEIAYIGRKVIYENMEFYEPVYIDDYYFRIPWYNPEWVSVDVMGTNLMITSGESFIYHECLPKQEQSLDLAFVITGGEEEEASVDIEKKVWDPENEAWVESIDANVCTNVKFQITVHNNGGVDLTNVKVVDDLPDYLKYVAGSATVNGNPQEPIIVGNKLTWTIAGTLKPCNTVIIEFKAHVEKAGEDENKATVTADSPTGPVSDSDTAVVHGHPAADTTPPTVKIVKPEKAIYLFNSKIMPFILPVIIGGIDVEAQATDNVGGSGMNKVEFYIDNVLQGSDTDIDGDGIYVWKWSTPAFFSHTIKVLAIDNAGNQAKDDIVVLKFF